MAACELCPRRCGADRKNGIKGFCGETSEVRVARAALHMWEEPCISGDNGSGTVFFTGCTLRCVFCQNHVISDGEVGKTVSVRRLADIFHELNEKGANNINLVTPGHFAPQIIRALDLARNEGMQLPVVWNSGGYERQETLKMLEGYVDVFLPDFKYLNPLHAKKYSMAEDYPDVAKAAVAEMVRQAGFPEFDERGIMTKGVIVRHLLLPGCLADAKRIVEYLYQTYGNRIYLSLMNQYTPVETLDQERYPELARKVPDHAYERLVDYAISLGVEQAFIQEGETAKESFIPPFTLEGV
ncbi:MAG: radical SAM protein [Bariatricus sp.]